MTQVRGPRGTYRPCLTCRAPIVVPFPPTWELEMIKEGPPSGSVKSFITVHRDDCTAPYADPQPGIAVRVPGTTVASLSFNLPGAVPDDPLGMTRAVQMHTAHDPTVTFVPPTVSTDLGFLFADSPTTVGEQPDWVTLGYTDAGTMSTDGVTWYAPGEAPTGFNADPGGVLGGGVLHSEAYDRDGDG